MTKTPTSLAAGLLLVFGALPAPAQEPLVNSSAPVTVIGCVEREKDYRTRIGDPGVGAVGHIVLSGAHLAATPAKREDYSINGRLESQLIPQVGAEVEVVAFVSDMPRYESPGRPVILPRLVVTAWHATGSSCALPH